MYSVSMMSFGLCFWCAFSQGLYCEQCCVLISEKMPGLICQICLHYKLYMVLGMEVSLPPPKVFENLVFRIFLTDYIFTLEDHDNVCTSCLEIKPLKISSNEGHRMFLQRRQYYGTCVHLGGDDQVPCFLYSFHNLGFIFASFTTSHTFSPYQKKKIMLKNVFSCLLLKLSRFDSSLCTVVHLQFAFGCPPILPYELLQFIESCEEAEMVQVVLT